MPHFLDPATQKLHFLEDGLVPAMFPDFPRDAVQISDSEAETIRAQQNTPTQDQLVADFTNKIQQRLDDFARTRNYDGILSACTYATSAVLKFQTEGLYAVQARDATWAAAYAVLDKVIAGNWPVNGANQMPTSISDIAGELPALAWPAT